MRTTPHLRAFARAFATAQHCPRRTAQVPLAAHRSFASSASQTSSAARVATAAAGTSTGPRSPLAAFAATATPSPAAAHQQPRRAAHAAPAPSAPITDTVSTATTTATGTAAQGVAGTASAALDVAGGDDDDSNMRLAVFRCLLRVTKRQAQDAVRDAVLSHVRGATHDNWHTVALPDTQLAVKFRVAMDASRAVARPLSSAELNYVACVQDLVDVLHAVPQRDVLNPHARIDRVEVLAGVCSLPPNVVFIPSETDSNDIASTSPP